MKKIIIYAITLLLVILLAACGGNSAKMATKSDSSSPANTQTKKEEQAQKVLVVYYSRSGNTSELANQIHKMVGGDIVEIQTVNSYPSEYDAVVKQAKQEIETGYKPALKTKIDNIKSYDVIFVGSPIWWGTIAPPVATFLSENDLSGKTIVPFVTHAGSGLAQSAEDITKLCPQATILGGIAVFGKNVKSSQNELSTWLHEIEILK